MTDLPRENVQSYPRPPALEAVPQRITIRLGGILVAYSELVRLAGTASAFQIPPRPRTEPKVPRPVSARAANSRAPPTPDVPPSLNAVATSHGEAVSTQRPITPASRRA